MEIKENIFRSYDIRGIYPEELNEETVYHTIKGFCAFYPHIQKVVVAHDPRLSSKPLADAAIKSFLEEGKDVIYLSIAPDPLFYYAIFRYFLDGGVMISGSHNPKEYNGLTFHIRKKGAKQSEDVIGEGLQKIKDLAKESLSKPKTPHFNKGKFEEKDYSQEYVDYVASKISLAKPLKVILDPGNGACGYLPEKVFKKLGCETETIFGDFDGNFPNHAPDPYVPENRRFIEQAVIEKKADLGFMYDADGDRVAIIDGRGRAVDGDASLLVLARQALSQKKGPVVHCMRASKAFLDDMKSLGAESYFSVSHHNAVIEKVLEKDAVFGGEITFHFLFPLDYFLVDDAVFASLKLAQAAAEHDPFDSYIDSLPRYHASPEISIQSDDRKKVEIVQGIQKYLKDHQYDFIDIDGARINFKNGWALVRYSNTAPIIKCRFEGDTPESLKEIQKESLEIFEKNGLEVDDQILNQLGLSNV